MSLKKLLAVVLVVTAVALLLNAGPGLTAASQGSQSASEEREHTPAPSAPGITIPYSGRLADEAGRPVADGVYSLALALYNSVEGGQALWSEVQEGVQVLNGELITSLGIVERIPSTVLDVTRPLWLEVGVRGPGDSRFTALSPRQRVSAVPMSPATTGQSAACPHDHFGEDWSGSAWAGLSIANSGGWGLAATTALDTAVRGVSTSGYGVYGKSETNVGVEGYSAGMFGVRGQSDSGVGVVGRSVTGAGVYGESTHGASINGYSEIGTGVRGESVYNYGVHAQSRDNHALYAYSNHATAVYGETDGDWSYISGVYGKSNLDHANGVSGVNTAGGVGLYGYSDSGYAAYISGLSYFSGLIWKAGGGFKIDHPLDPANQYLYHSFVESPDMKNVYDGVVVLDAKGAAWVELPDWFEAVNGNFRYQLTPIGAPAPGLYIAQEIEGNRFQIAGGAAGLKVSWQVTGIRHDPYAAAHPIPVEQAKPPDEQGTYLHPVEQGRPLTEGLDYRQNRSPEPAAPGGGR